MRVSRRRSAFYASLVLLSTLLLGSCLSLGQSLELLASNAFSQGLMDRYEQAMLKAAAKAAADAAQPLSPREEYYIGRAVAARIFSLYGVYENQVLIEYLNKLGQGLALYSTRPEIYIGYRFAVLDSPQINAFASPGGHILVTRGLLSKVESEDELAAVLAHEIAHVSLGHGLASIQGSRLTQIAAEYALNAGMASGGEGASFTEAFGEAISELATVLLISGYSQSFELQADQEARRIITRAGYDSAALDRLISKLPSHSQESSGFAQTHPEPLFRLEALSEKLASPGYSRPRPRYWPKLRMDENSNLDEPTMLERYYSRMSRFASMRELF